MMQQPLLASNSGGSWLRRLLGNTRRLHARADWARFAGPDWADQILAAHVTDDFHAKQGRSTGRWLLENQGQQLAVYLKRHYRLPWWQGLLATFWPGGNWSPALQEYQHLQWAQGQGLPVPRIVAAGEYLQPFGKLQSFLAIEELSGMLALHQAIPRAARHLEPRHFRIWKAGLARELARLTRILHQRRFFHKDLYLCHFYIPRELCEAGPRIGGLTPGRSPMPDWRGRVHMIDFHRLGHHPLTWPWWRVKDLGELLYSSDVEGVDARDRLRFWRYYLEPRRRTQASWLSWCVRRKGDRYRQHNDKKRHEA